MNCPKCFEKVQKLKEKVKNLKTWQKILLLSVAVLLPAGIVVATMAIAAMKRRP